MLLHVDSDAMLKEVLNSFTRDNIIRCVIGWFVELGR